MNFGFLPQIPSVNTPGMGRGMLQKQFIDNYQPWAPGLEQLNIPGGAQTTQNPGFWSMDSFLGGKDAAGNAHMGWGLGLGALAKGGMDTWLGMQQLDLAKKSFMHNQGMDRTNLMNQANTTNEALASQWQARESAAPGQYGAKDDYMRQYGVSGTIS